MTELTEAELDDWQAEAEKSPGQSFYVATDFMLRLIAAARASLSPWRSIESAPKDGTEIAGCWPSGMRLIVWWSNERQSWRDDRDSLNAPTHWCEIPPAPHSNGERDDETKEFSSTEGEAAGRNEGTDRGGSLDTNQKGPEPQGEDQVALPSDAKPDVLCSVPDCPIHAPPPLESGEDAYACPLCGGWKHTGIGADECQCSPPPTPTQGEVEREKLNKASRQADAAMERMLDKLQRLGQEFDASPLGIAELVGRLRAYGDKEEDWKWEPTLELVNEAAAALLAIAAELERVRGYLKRAHEEAGVELLDAKTQIRAQAREIERFREALERIVALQITDSSGNEVAEDSVYDMRSIARAALNRE